jgi:hypothetical protein
MERITNVHLNAAVERINRVLGMPLEPYTSTTNADGTVKYVANPGNFHLDFAYGGVSLHQFVGDAGGESDVLSCGHTTKRELFHLMHAFLRGIDTAKRYSK